MPRQSHLNLNARQRVQRERILRLARSSPRLTQRQIAAVVGCHPDSVSRHLRGLHPLGARHRTKPQPFTSQEAASLTRLAMTGFSADITAAARGTDSSYYADDELYEQERDRYSQDPEEAAEPAARAPDCPPALLEKLSHRRRRVRRQVAANPNCPADTLDRLAGDPSCEVREAAAGNPQCPPAALRRCVRDPGWSAVEEYTGPPTRQRAIRRDPGQQARTAAAGNPNTPPTALHRLARDPQDRVRAAVAANPACPTRIRDRLTRDPHPGVRARVFANPNPLP